MNVPDDMREGFIHSTKHGELEIIKYRGALRVDIKFLLTGFLLTTRSESIRKGQVKDRNKPVIFGVGFIGKGKFKSASATEKRTPEYEKWYHMLERCYSERHHKKYPTYKGCSVCSEWHNFQEFAKWLHLKNKNFKSLELDKDILLKGNKVYSPSTCSLVSRAKNIEFSQSVSKKIRSPEGEIVSIFNVSKFARDNNLSRGCLSLMWNGHRDSHKGWTAV